MQWAGLQRAEVRSEQPNPRPDASGPHRRWGIGGSSRAESVAPGSRGQACRGRCPDSPKAAPVGRAARGGAARPGLGRAGGGRDGPACVRRGRRRRAALTFDGYRGDPKPSRVVVAVVSHVHHPGRRTSSRGSRAPRRSRSRRDPRGRQGAALGPPGTGKTVAARTLAAELRQPLLLGGMISATVLPIILVPVFYVVIRKETKPSATTPSTSSTPNEPSDAPPGTPTASLDVAE